MLLEIENLEVDFSGARVLRDVSLTLAKGDVICLIGANGAGKTTTLRTISGLNKITRGEIRFRGRVINQLSPPEILGLGIAHVLQEGRVFTEMTVIENLLMGAFARGKDPAAINREMKLIFQYFPILSDRIKQRAGALSGGERQMLAIGRALMSRPKVLILDEPTAGLAPKVVKQVGQIIQKLNQDGLSIILVEQNADMALGITDYGYVMERGRIVIEGTTKDLKKNDAVRKAYLGI